MRLVGAQVIEGVRISQNNFRTRSDNYSRILGLSINLAEFKEKEIGNGMKSTQRRGRGLVPTKGCLKHW